MNIAQKFGHSSNLTYPSLVGLHTDFEHNSKMQGVKKVALVSLYIDGQKRLKSKVMYFLQNMEFQVLLF